MKSLNSVRINMERLTEIYQDGQLESRYHYDANGNIVQRNTASGKWLYEYDAENRLTETIKNGQIESSYLYDGDGKREWSKDYEGYPAGELKETIYIVNYFEFVREDKAAGQGEGGVCTGTYCTYLPMIFQMPRGVSYYYADGQRIAMRDNDGVVSYLYGDQLGSVSAVADANGNLVSTTLYEPWGTTRYENGDDITDYGYTGQMQEGDIYFYNARWYDPAIGRFIQADTIVPPTQGIQGFDRYAYVNNNPLIFTDPSGHCIGPLAAVCFAIGTWIVSNAGWITAVATTGAIVSYLGTSNADPELANNEVASQEALDRANLKAIFWISSSNMLLEFGEYFSYPRLDSLTTDQAKASTTSNSSNAQTQDYQVPSNLGFKGEPEVITMQPGDQFDRIGHLYGDYGAAPNTPIVQRSLPPSNPGNPLRLFEVTKPIENVLRGTTAPAYGHIGGGIQYKFPMTIQKMLDHGFIKELR